MKPLTFLLMRVPPRIRFVVISPLAVLPSRLVAAMPVAIRAFFWAGVR